MSTPSMYFTLTQPRTQIGEVLDEDASYRLAPVAAPRQVVITDAYAALTGCCTVHPSVKELMAGEQVALAEIQPRGTVDRVDGLFECLAGWRVVAHHPISEIFGPQADHVLDLAAAMQAALLEGAAAGEDLQRYTAAVAELGDGHLQAALAALCQAGADAQWWEGQITPGSVGETVALAARDLIGTVPGWTSPAYRALLTPWAGLHGTWPHPHDQEGPHRASAAPPPCAGRGVGVLIVGEDGRVLIGDRVDGAGAAPVAGHVEDARPNPPAAADKVTEVTGLTVTALEHLTTRWRADRCHRGEGPHGPGHTWDLYRARTTGDLCADPGVFQHVRWAATAELVDLASRTHRYALGQLSARDWARQPGIAPVWVLWLQMAGFLPGLPHDLLGDVEEIVETGPRVWSAACAPGGLVCAVPDPTGPEGVCGHPVESEPCPDHYPQAPDAPAASLHALPGAHSSGDAS